MKWLKNFTAQWRLVFYEIQNWFYVKSIIRKHQDTADWQRYNLRADWIGRIYTVLNPMLPGDRGDTKEVLSYKYAERLKPINMYLDSLGLGQSIYPAYEEIQDSESYLIVYSPIFNAITPWRVTVFVAFWAAFFISPLDTYTWNGMKWVYHLFLNLDI